MKTYEAKILDVLLDEFIQEFGFRVRFHACMQAEEVTSLRQLFGKYPSGKKLLVINNMGRKTIREFVGDLQKLEHTHGVRFTWLDTLEPEFKPD